MISRRNIRIKVLQTLYQVELEENIEKKIDPVKQLQSKLDETNKLFLYLLFFITEVARYAERDALKKASKNIVTQEDLETNTKISGNKLLWEIIEKDTYQKAISVLKPGFSDTRDWVKKIYGLLVESEEYKKYVSSAHRDIHEERDILEYIFSNLMMLNEDFDNHMEDHFTCWYDDVEIMNSLMLNYFKKPGTYNLLQLAGAIKWNFAKDLLLAAIEKKEFTLSMIKPRLKNWDSERIALLDMLIMRLGICEFLYFETIPPKVTINEYIDIAKEYSTPQSGFFVNGVLDGIHKDLIKEDKLHKSDFKQQ